MKTDHNSLISTLASNLSADTGVTDSEVRKLLEALGIEALLKNVEDAAGQGRVKALSVGDLRLAARLARSSHAI